MGCMAERLKSKLLEEEKLVDIVVGPDSYRDLPNLVKVAETGQKAVNVLLKRGDLRGYQSCSVGRKWRECIHFNYERL